MDKNNYGANCIEGTKIC